MATNLFVIIRVLVGCMFVVSGFEKLIGSYQNFLYVVQGYELFPPLLENAAAHVMPWAELFLGAFLLLGLWLKWALRVAAIVMGMFIFVVAQAILRGLSIIECGCFGDFISVPLHVVLIFDTIMLFVIDFLMRKEERTSVLSLDRYFENEG
ncbi:MAG: DoxX family membrane protein [Candidatus Omnitrophica bacterium]|nr:DoxX family membrane protein [Candidatus Omnitrophota bacterium]MCK5259764.1 DoxX family membrane protein [Candidatus Omnitrophota bacterium]